MIQFNINQYHFWDPSERIHGDRVMHGQPELPGVKPLVKRRMPLLAKAIHAINEAAGLHHLPTVFASQNAELSRTIKLVRQFGADLSPAMFSMSVNNAIPGLLSVIAEDNAPYTVIDSMSGLLEMALFEAMAQLNDHPKVKVVCFEEPTNEAHLDLVSQTDVGGVLVLVIEPGQGTSITPSKMAEGSAEHGPLRIIDYHGFLSQATTKLQNRCGRIGWDWQQQ